jgi:hypothetical protein
MEKGVTAMVCGHPTENLPGDLGVRSLCKIGFPVPSTRRHWQKTGSPFGGAFLKAWRDNGGSSVVGPDEA